MSSLQVLRLDTCAAPYKNFSLVKSASKDLIKRSTNLFFNSVRNGTSSYLGGSECRCLTVLEVGPNALSKSPEFLIRTEHSDGRKAVSWVAFRRVKYVLAVPLHGHFGMFSILNFPVRDLNMGAAIFLSFRVTLHTFHFASASGADFGFVLLHLYDGKKEN